MNFLKMKDPASTITHFIPFLAGIVGLVFFIIQSSHSLSKLITTTIFGIGIIVLYGASSMYHWIRTTPEKELVLRKLDHGAIFLLISSTYTPIIYFGLDGAWKWSILSVVWSIAILGMVMKIWVMNLPRWISTALYLGLGWIAVIPLYKLIQNLPLGAIILLLAGGILYTIGGVVYGTKKLNFFPNRFGFHEIFHIFVALGTLSHYFMVYFFIIPI
ncbi:MAG TPA: hemolysin III family protein [Bacillota bacterium]|nr:hemolysin III family protein [Bacillota bacterium]